jgi:parallel beta-helix repeat protein
VLPQRLTSGSYFVSLLLLTTSASAQIATPGSSSPGWHDVTRHGGKGDGIADDAAAIRAAARALPQSGGVLYFPPGHYSLRSPIVLKNGVSLRGAGMGVSRISQANGANLSSLVSYSAASFVTVSDLTFDGNKATNATRNDGLLNFENSADVIVKNCEFKDAVGHPSVGVALRFGGDNKRILIDGNYVHDAGAAGKPADGIYFGGSSVRIVNNLIVKASDTGIVYEAVSNAVEAPSDHGVIASNIVRNTPQGIAVDAAIAGTLGSTTAVTGNTVDGANAVNGASIFVFKGARGRAQSAVSVVGNVIRDSTDGHGILLDAVSDVVINGNVLSGISTQKAKHGIAVLRSKGISVVGNTIRGSGGDGISLQGVTETAVTGNTVGEPNLAGVEAVGIDVRDQGSVRSDGVVVVANNVSGTKHKYGLQVADGATNLIAMGNSLAGAVRSFNRATAGRVAFSANLTPGAPDSSLSASGEWRSLQLSDGGVASTTLRVAAAEPGDGVVCSHDQLGPRLLLLTCHVESSGVVRAILLNRSGGPIVVPAGTLRALVVRRNDS